MIEKIKDLLARVEDLETENDVLKEQVIFYKGKAAEAKRLRTENQKLAAENRILQNEKEAALKIL